MAGWLKTFAVPFFQGFGEAEQKRMIQELCDDLAVVQRCMHFNLIMFP